MSKKKVNFKPVHDLRDIEKKLDEWVGSNEPAEVQHEKSTSRKETPTENQNLPKNELVETIKLSVDISINLHRRIKTSCAMQGISMKEQLIEILEENFPE